MYMNDTAVCFVNAHFTAHIEENEKRIMDYKYFLAYKLNFKLSSVVERDHF